VPSRYFRRPLVPSCMAPLPSLELHVPLARSDHEGVPPRRAIPALDDARVRSEGLTNTNRQVSCPRSPRGIRFILQGLGEPTNPEPGSR